MIVKCWEQVNENARKGDHQNLLASQVVILDLKVGRFCGGHLMPEVDYGQVQARHPELPGEDLADVHSEPLSDARPDGSPI